MLIDINECALNNHNCDPNAECIDVDGSYTCKCKHGLHGDGKTCEGCIITIRQEEQDFLITAPLLDDKTGFTRKETIQTSLTSNSPVNIEYSQEGMVVCLMYYIRKIL